MALVRERHLSIFSQEDGDLARGRGGIERGEGTKGERGKKEEEDGGFEGTEEREETFVSQFELEKIFR